MTRARLARAATAFVFLLVGAEADSASAGVYNVRACDPAFGADVNHVFSGTGVAACAPGRGMQTGVSGSGRASLQACAPNGTRVVAVRATASSRWQGAGYERRVDGGDCGDGGLVAGGGLPPSPSSSDTQNWMVTGLSLGGVRLTTGCVATCTGTAVTDWNQISFTVDDYTPPSIVGGRGLWGRDGWVRGTWTTAFDASDPTGIRSMAVRIDGVEKASVPGACQPDGSITRLNPCSSTSMTLSRDVDTATVPDGRRDLTLEGRDGGRNTAAPRTDVRIDNSAPEATLARSEDDYSRTVTWDVDDPHAGVDAASLAAAYSADDGATWQPMTGSWADGRYAATVPSGVPDGTVRVRIGGRDNAQPGGNEFASSESVEVDATPPGAPSISVPDRWLNRRDASHWDASLAASSEPRSGVQGYSVARDGSDPDASVDVDGPSWRIDELADGATTLKARAVSRAGVASPIAQAVIRMDRELPTASLRGAGNPAVPHPGPVTVTLAGRDRVSGTAQVAYSLDGAAWALVPGDEARVPVAGGGEHRLSYYVVDEAGNTSVEGSRTIVIAEGTDPLRAPRAGFSATATNPRTTFTAAKRFGDPCPAEATLIADRAATIADDALVGFPLPAAPDCTVESAVLRMEGDSTIEVKRANSAWTASAVTWATRPGTVGPGVTGRGGWDVTAQVQGLYDHGDNGLYLRGVDGPVKDAARAELAVRFSE